MTISTGVIIGATAVLLFLACRALVLWYWNINTIVSLLQEIADRLSNRIPKEEQKQI